MDMQAQVNNIRSQSEEIFYALSASMDREQAEKLTPDIMKICIEREINAHKLAVGWCDKTPGYMNKPVYGNEARKYRKGVLDANIIRKQSHQSTIEELNNNLQLIKML